MLKSSTSLFQRAISLNLQKVLFASFTVVAMVPVVCLGAWVQRHASNAEVSAVQDKHLLLAKNISGALSRYAMDLIAIFTEKSENYATDLSAQEQQLLAAFNIRMMTVVSDEGPIFKFGSAVDLPDGGLAALAQERVAAFRRLQTVAVSPVMLNTRQEPLIYICRVTTDGTLVLAAVSTEYIQQVQRSISFGKDGHAAIVDQTGQAIAHPLPTWQKNAQDMSKLYPVQQMLSRQTGVAQFYSPAKQAAMIAGYSFVPETGWGVMIPQPMAELEAKVNQTRLWALLIAFVGFLLAVGISWQLAQCLLSPLQTVIDASRQLAQGKLLVDADFRHTTGLPREMRELLKTFNQMALEVSQTRTNLQDKVDEQTQALLREVEERQRLQQQLLQMATHDALTGLPNRRLLTEQLQQTIDRLTRSHEAAALLFIDLDGFKQVNDQYGHAIGDQLLIQVATRLKQGLRASDSVFRWGGDEFIVLSESSSTIKSAIGLANKIVAALKMPYAIQKNEIVIGSSIGVKQINTHVGEITTSQVIAAADAAMYEAKSAEDGVVVYSGDDPSVLDGTNVSLMRWS